MVEWNIKKSTDQRMCACVLCIRVHRYERVKNGKEREKRKRERGNKERAKKLDRVLLFLTLPP